MIAVDSNILVYAHRRDSHWYDSARAAMTDLAEGTSPWAIPWPCVHEFLAVVTRPRIYSPPSSLAEAQAQVAIWLESPTLLLLSEGDGYWDTLAAVLAERLLRHAVEQALAAGIGAVELCVAPDLSHPCVVELARGS